MARTDTKNTDKKQTTDSSERSTRAELVPARPQARTREEMAGIWANAPGRVAPDMVLEDYAIVQRQGGIDRSARIARVINEETGAKELVVVSTDEGALSDLVGDLQEGLPIRAKLLHRPKAEELLKIMGERPMPGMLGPAPPRAGRFRVEVLDADGRVIATEEGLPHVTAAARWTKEWNARKENQGFFARVLIFEREEIAREYERRRSALRRID